MTCSGPRLRQQTSRLKFRGPGASAVQLDESLIERRYGPVLDEGMTSLGSVHQGQGQGVFLDFKEAGIFHVEVSADGS